jgi:hypothetical protein
MVLRYTASFSWDLNRIWAGLYGESYEAHDTHMATTSWVFAIFGESHEDVLHPHMDMPDAVGFRRTCAVSNVLGAGR